MVCPALAKRREDPIRGNATPYQVERQPVIQQLAGVVVLAITSFWLDATAAILSLR